MSDLIEVRIERHGVSDERVLVSSVLVESGDEVAAGDPIAVVETSKASYDVDSPADGHFHTPYEEGDHVPVGGLLGYVTSSADTPAGLADLRAPESDAAATADAGGPVFSASALTRMAELAVERDAFADYDLVTAADVDAVAGSSADAVTALPEGLPEGGIAVFGGGGYAKMCIDLVRGAGSAPVAVVVVLGGGAESTLLGVPVIGSESDETLAALLAAGVRDAIVAIGDNTRRTRLSERLAAAGFRRPAIVHASAVVEPSAKLADGVHVHALAHVGSSAAIGADTIVNTGAVVSHDCVVGRGVHVAPGAILAGHVEIGDHAVFGMGASAYIGVRVGARAVVANGVALFDHVPDGAKAGPPGGRGKG